MSVSRTTLAVGVLAILAALESRALAAQDSPDGPSTVGQGTRALRHGVVLESGTVQYLDAGFVYSGSEIGLAYLLTLPKDLEIAAGMRALWGGGVPGRASAEGFVSASLAADFGTWHPRSGLEIGYSGLVSGPPQSYGWPAGADWANRPAPSPVYVVIVAAPLRARFGPLDVTVFQLDVGTTVPDMGRAVRVAIQWARLEWRM